MQAKKRQIYLEETYGGSMRELELLLDNFQVDPRASLKSSTSSGELISFSASHDKCTIRKFAFDLKTGNVKGQVKNKGPMDNAHQDVYAY